VTCYHRFIYLSLSWCTTRLTHKSRLVRKVLLRPRSSVFSNICNNNDNPIACSGSNQGNSISQSVTPVMYQITTGQKPLVLVGARVHVTVLYTCFRLPCSSEMLLGYSRTVL
jgi:hypothetical protein